MKIIYTSYYANRKVPNELNKIPISRIPPKWFKGNRPILDLAPSKKLLMDYKKGKAGIGEYIRRFKHETGTYISEQYKLKDNDCLLCFEKIGDFCHRHIVAEELSKSGDLVIEYKPEYKIWIDVNDPMYGFYPHVYIKLVCDVINRLGKNSKITIQRRVRLPYTSLKLNIEKFKKDEADLIIKTTSAIKENEPNYSDVPIVYITYRQVAQYAYNNVYPKPNKTYNRVTVFGSPKFNSKDLVIPILNMFKHPKMVINDNNSLGLNSVAVAYANANDIKVKHFSVDTGKYGNKAGAIRNTQVMKSSDVVIFFKTANNRSIDELIEQCKKPMVIITEDEKGGIKEEMVNI